MKILHTSDWHLGLEFFGVDPTADQQHMIGEIVRIAREQQVGAVIVAGDVFDRAVVAPDAIALYNDAMRALCLELGLPVVLIAGNHDGAARLSTLSDLLRGAVRLLFQPAEETDGGALPMVRAGAMEGVCAVYGLHVQPYLNVGQIDTRLGTLNAATNEVRLTVHGRSSHAAHPDEAVDAAVCAAQLLTALQTAVSRSASPLKPCVLTFGEIHGGTACNVICDEVKLNGTLRTVDPELRTLMKRRIREISAGIAAAFGATVDVEITDGYSALINNPAEAARALRLAGELLGRENAMLRADPSMGGEDFSFFAEQAPAAFFHLGCASQQPAAPLHSAGFTVDERCLPIGSVMHCALVFDKLNEEAES